MVLLSLLSMRGAAADEQAAMNTIKDKEAILQMLEAWASAWSAKNTNEYLSHYSPQFQVPGNKPRLEWAAGRKKSIENKRHIAVTIASPHIVVRDNTAAVQFHQTYVSDRFSSQDHKTLMLMKQGDRWRIVQELAGK